ncbi:hypothetical protein CHS0354_015542 [Potamilus streckersoni]|uniref:Uncharacterized protein n=1 Tax=Potamilus streckersoni TaxID=2493646 RepID=A0AAE0T5X4_9BIVA|nr:hypothetical protein CHS0354_015542 [Potamilus streckersoni]
MKITVTGALGKMPTFCPCNKFIAIMTLNRNVTSGFLNAGQSNAVSTEHHISPRHGLFANLFNPGPRHGFGPNPFHNLNVESQSSRERPIVIYAEVVNIDQSWTNEEKASLPPTPAVNVLPLTSDIGFLGNIGLHHPELGGSFHNPFVLNVPDQEYPYPLYGNFPEADRTELVDSAFSMEVTDPFELQPMLIEPYQSSFNKPSHFSQLNNENAELRPIQNNYLSLPSNSPSSTEPASSVESQNQEKEHAIDVNTLLQEFFLLKGLVDKENHKLSPLNGYNIPPHQLTLNSGPTITQQPGQMQKNELMEESQMTKYMTEKLTTIAPSTVKVPSTLPFKIPTPISTTKKPEYKFPKPMSDLQKSNEKKP